MSALEYRDHRADPRAWADELRIPREAVELYFSTEVIDLHVVSFLWTRLLPGYSLARRRRPRMPQAAFLNQADLPRIREAQLAGACFDIPTNPFRRKHRRPHATRRNVRTIRETLRRFPADFAVARNASDYREARARGVVAGFIALQGGDAAR
jgi:membrane dipeptidase